MDTTKQTATFGRGDSNPRDPSTHRRAYLDTYARRRAGLSDVEPEVVSELPTTTMPITPASQDPVQPAVQITASTAQPFMPVEQPPVIAQSHQITQTPVVFAQPAVVAVPIVTPVQAVQPHVFQAATPQPEQSVENFSQPQSIQPAHHRSYLDTLTRRHAAAVAQAPAFEETVFEPSLSPLTQSLLQTDAKTDENIEANLRALYEDQSLTSQISKNTKSASAAHVRTIVASAMACGIIAVGIFSFMSSYSSQPVVAEPIGAPVIEVEAPVTQPASGTPVKQQAQAAPKVDATYPVRLVMSSIGVNAPVESLGTTADGLIDVPQTYGMVGWYNKSSVPGKPGPAVLVGHYTGGNGGVFDKLKDLNDGDLVTTTNGRGESVTYKVTAKNEYDRDKVPMADIFKNSTDSRLQIITCSGKWQSKNYDKRLVITAEIVK